MMEMKQILVAVFFCSLFCSYFAEEISSAGPYEKSNTEKAVTICGQGKFYFDFTIASVTCEPSFSALITFYSNGTFSEENSYGTWNSDGTIINWSYPPLSSDETLVTVYMGEISNGKMSGTSRSYVGQCGCWSADISLTCTPNCNDNYY